MSRAPVFEWLRTAKASDLAKIRPLMQTDRARRAMERGWDEGPIHTFGGHLSTDNDWLTVVLEFLRLTNKKGIVPEVDELGRVHSRGLRADFQGVRHIPGFPMSTATWPLYDNSTKRKSKNLSDKWTQQWHRNLAEAWVRLVFTGIEPEPMRIRQGSSSCIPLFETERERRIEIATTAFKDAEKAGKLMLKGDFGTAFRLYQIGGAYYVVFRRQSSDKVTVLEGGKVEGKPREVADREYAVTGGEKGHLFISSKTFEVSDLTPEVTEFMASGQFLRQRLRVATGISGSIGAALTVIFQAARTHLYKEYSFTYHHTTRQQKRDKLRNFDFTIAADVSDHDTVWPLWIVDDVLTPTLLNMGYSDWWVELLRVSLRLPVYVAAVNSEEGRTLIGDWEHPDSNLGLSSGHPATDLLGSWNMTIQYAITQIEHTAPHYAKECETVDGAMRFLHSFMKGEKDIALLDKSDDALLLWKAGPLVQKATELHHKMVKDEQVNPYMLISYENGFAFLGDLLLYDVTRQLSSVEMIGNINSFIINMMCPEYSAALDRSDTDRGYQERQRSKRPYPGLSWETTPTVYGSCPWYSDVVACLDEAWYNVFRKSFVAERDQLLIDDQKLLFSDLKRRKVELSNSFLARSIDIGSLSISEVEVLSDKEKIQWKYTQPGSVRDEIRDLLTNAVSMAHVEPYFHSIYKNVRG